MALLLDEEALAANLSAVEDGWEIAGEGASAVLTRAYTFKDFLEAMAFVNRVAEQAESLDHHPDITINYNRVRLDVTNHSAGGISDRCFGLVRLIDALE